MGLSYADRPGRLGNNGGLSASSLASPTGVALVKLRLPLVMR
jgi:hypothetical protein